VAICKIVHKQMLRKMRNFIGLSILCTKIEIVFRLSKILVVGQK